jgi:hypothetical protein
VTTHFYSKDIESLVIRGNAFVRCKLRAVSLGNEHTPSSFTLKNAVIEDNLFVDWNYRNLHLYQCIGFGGNSTTYPATIQNLIVRKNVFAKFTDSGYSSVGNTVLGNNPYPPQNVSVGTLIYTDNVFINVAVPLGNLGSAQPATLIVRRNAGYPTEASGTATIPAGKTSVTVNHGLISAPSKVLVTPSGNVGSVWVSNITSTTFTINCSAAPAADAAIYWYAEV